MNDQCETTGEGCCSTETSCGCGSDCESGCGDPLDKVVHSWIGAFFEAKREVQVDLLKAKILKTWGPKMDKAADAVFETVEAIWKSKTGQADVKAKFRERLRSILFEAQK